MLFLVLCVSLKASDATYNFNHFYDAITNTYFTKDIVNPPKTNIVELMGMVQKKYDTFTQSHQAFIKNQQSSTNTFNVIWVDDKNQERYKKICKPFLNNTDYTFINDGYISLSNKLKVYSNKIEKKAKEEKSSSWAAYVTSFFIRKKLINVPPLTALEQTILKCVQIDAETPATKFIANIKRAYQKATAEAESSSDDDSGDDDKRKKYTWSPQCPPLFLPENFCNGIGNALTTNDATPCINVPEPGKHILPITQCWKEANKNRTRISDDDAGMDVLIPQCYSHFDLIKGFFVGATTGHNKTINLFTLPISRRIYTYDSDNDTLSIKVQTVSIPEPTCQWRAYAVTALALCPFTKHVMRSQYDIQNQKSTFKIHDTENILQMEYQIAGEIKKIVPIDDNTILYLVNDKLHKASRVGTQWVHQEIALNKSIVRFAVDQHSELCAYMQDNDQTIYTISKQALCSTNTDIDHHHSFDASEDGENNTILAKELQQKYEAEISTVLPKLQCHKGTIIAWYPQCAEMSGTFGSRKGNKMLQVLEGRYSAIHTFKTTFAQRVNSDDGDIQSEDDM
jgi:hypothetical protein